MKILIFEWGAGTYTHQDIICTFDKMGIDYHVVSYAFNDVNEDDFFEWRFGRCLDEERYDVVYSTNYFPLVSRCCHNRHIKYVSWSYDNPLDVPNIYETLGYEENFVFLFDKIQVEKYIKQGYSNVYHMPLAVNTNRLDQIQLSTYDLKKYESEISFVGKLYESPLQMYKTVMDDYSKGYIDSIIKSQGKIYGYYMVDDLLTDDFVERINIQIKNLKSDAKIELSREVLSYAIGAQITREERLVLLKLLGAHFKVKLYSREDHEALRGIVEYMGSCGYNLEMPKIFKASKINLNINLKISQSGIPLRVMDVLGSGGFLISSYQPELAEYFVDGKEVVMYSSIEDAYEKVDYYLKHDDERKQIALNGYSKVKEQFNYEKQLRAILAIANTV